MLECVDSVDRYESHGGIDKIESKWEMVVGKEFDLRKKKDDGMGWNGKRLLIFLV